MLTACGGVTYKDVVSHAEAHLYYPGSRVVSREGGDEERGGLDTGRSPAVATTDLATDATMSQVYAWYEGQLKSRGWKLRKTETIDGGSGDDSIDGGGAGASEMDKILGLKSGSIVHITTDGTLHTASVVLDFTGAHGARRSTRGR